MSALDDLINDDTGIPCPYTLAYLCKWGPSYRCKGCDKNPETFIDDPKLLEEFKDHPWAPYCLTCGEFDAAVNHPGHLIAVGFEDYKEKVPQMIMDRILGKEFEEGTLDSW